MFLFQVGVCAVASVLSVLVTVPAIAADEDDAERIQGTWEITSVTVEEKEVDSMRGFIVFEADNQIIFKLEGSPESRMLFSLYPEKTPPQIDSRSDPTVTDGRKGVMGQGIYHLDGDDLKICMGDGPLQGGTRPTRFDSSAGTLMILKRKSQEAAQNLPGLPESAGSAEIFNSDDVTSVPRTSVLSADYLLQHSRRGKILYDEVAPATVALLSGDVYVGSGVIVTPEGHVLTHGHHFIRPLFQKKWTVVLSDGRRVSARQVVKIEGLFFEGSLLKTAEQGQWPFVKLAEAPDPKVGDMCFHLGHPGGFDENRPAVFRMGRILQVHERFIETSVMVSPGDSGGPLFDMEGRLIGLCTSHGSGARGVCRHARFGHFVNNWDYFTRSFPTDVESWKKIYTQSIPESAPDSSLQQITQEARRVTVRIICDDEPRALGILVRQDGLVATKHSELDGRIECVLRGGDRLPARIAKVFPHHDVAILKIDQQGLPVATWRTDGRSTGEFVASVGSLGQGVGIVSVGTVRPIAAESATAGFECTQADHGVQVSKLSDHSFAKDRIHRGDVILGINSTAVTDLASFVRETTRKDMVAGDRIQCRIRRKGKEMTVLVALSGETSWHLWLDGPLSFRRTGFPAVFEHDAVLHPSECGGPLVNLAGEMIGMNIACARRHATFTIPPQVLLDLVDEYETSGEGQTGRDGRGDRD